MFKSGSFKKFHRNKRTPIKIADFVDGADVGMVQSRSSAGFTAESLKGLGVSRQLIRKKLEGNIAAKFCIFNFVNHTHAATAKLVDNAVVRDRLSDERVGIRHSGAILGCAPGQVNEVVG